MESLTREEASSLDWGQYNQLRQGLGDEVGLKGGLDKVDISKCVFRNRNEWYDKY